MKIVNRNSIKRIVLTVRAEKSNMTSLPIDHGCPRTLPSCEFSSFCRETVQLSLPPLFTSSQQLGLTSELVFCLILAAFRMAHRENPDEALVVILGKTCNELVRSKFFIFVSSIFDCKITSAYITTEYKCIDESLQRGNHQSQVGKRKKRNRETREKHEKG